MERTCDVCIIGAGVMGLSVAYYLKRRGAGRVLVLEKEDSWSTGATAVANGGVRQQFSTAVNIRMSQLSLPVFEHFKEDVGTDILWRQYGYLYVTAKPEAAARLRETIAFQKAHDVPVEWVTPEQIRELAPYIRTDDLQGGAFGPKDGFCDSYTVAAGYGNAARQLGAEVAFGEQVTGITVVSGRVAGVTTKTSRIDTKVVVNAAGPFAGVVGRLAGMDVPVVPVRRQVVLTEPVPEIPERTPMTIDADTNFIMRSESGRIFLGWSDPDEPVGFNTSFDPDFIDQVVSLGIPRSPLLEKVRVNAKRCLAGLYEVTPDHHAIIGTCPVHGLYLANGFSGHGMMHAPAVGMILTDLIIDGSTSRMDIRPLRLSRFAEGDINVERVVH